KSQPNPAVGYSLCRLERYWSCRNSAGWDFLFQRISRFLAVVFYFYADCFHRRTESGFELVQSQYLIYKSCGFIRTAIYLKQKNYLTSHTLLILVLVTVIT